MCARAPPSSILLKPRSTIVCTVPATVPLPYSTPTIPIPRFALGLPIGLLRPHCAIFPIRLRFPPTPPRTWPPAPRDRGCHALHLLAPPVQRLQADSRTTLPQWMLARLLLFLLVGCELPSAKSAPPLRQCAPLPQHMPSLSSPGTLHINGTVRADSAMSSISARGVREPAPRGGLATVAHSGPIFGTWTAVPRPCCVMLVCDATILAACSHGKPRPHLLLLRRVAPSLVTYFSHRPLPDPWPPLHSLLFLRLSVSTT